jgi:hypothetical protein
MRYSRDKETIEESPCVNGGCRMSRQLDGWFQQSCSSALHIHFWCRLRRRHKSDGACAVLQEINQPKPQSVVLRRAEGKVQPWPSQSQPVIRVQRELDPRIASLHRPWP